MHHIRTVAGLSPSETCAPSEAAVVVLCAVEEVRDVISYWLSDLPVQSFVPGDGYEANELLKPIANGVLVTDRVLPPWPGLDTFRQLRSARPGLRIAYVEDGAPDARILARVAGATCILSRPLTRQAVVAALGDPRLPADA